MSKTSKKVPAVKNRKSIGVYMKRYWQLYLLLFLPMLYLIIFKYVPMVYIQIQEIQYCAERLGDAAGGTARF